MPRSKFTWRTIIVITRDQDALRMAIELEQTHKGHLEDVVRTKMLIKIFPAYLPVYLMEKGVPLTCVTQDVVGGREENQVIDLWEGKYPEKLYIQGCFPCKVEHSIGEPTFCGIR